MKNVAQRVFKRVLSNGLTILVCPKKMASKVSLQLWYNVGSKHEQPGEKGMAHFIEHMIFKGTEKMLSESDINLITHKLSGYANAFTSYDYTGYLFDVPVANWEQVLPVFADCMQNCSFQQEHMNSEVKAVIQELKMYRDDFTWTLADSLVSNIFESHPYHYPIIGYKQDLWSLQRETLVNFYKKYYTPANASLVLVGDLDPEDVFAKVEQSFGSIPSGQDIKRPEFFVNEDLQSKSITIYREVEQATCMLAFVLQGAQEKREFFYDIIAYLLANGKGSRLHKILVDQQELVISIGAMTYDLFEKEIFFIEFKPKHEQDIAKIKEIILAQIQDLAFGTIEEIELRRALKLANVDYQHLLEDVQKQAYAIGKSFVATGDAEYPFTYCDYNPVTLRDDLQSLLKEYFRPSLCHEGKVVKAFESDKNYLAKLQEDSDALDNKILCNKERSSTVEDGRYVNEIHVENIEKIDSIKPVVKVLPSGLKVILHHNDDIDLVECVLRYKANHHYDPKGFGGISYLVSKLMLEGTEKYPGAQFIQEVESYGISIDTAPGQISLTMLPDDAAKGFEFLGQMLQSAQCSSTDFERIKKKTKAQLIQFWDTPKSCIAHVASQAIYKDHPYGNMPYGTEQSLDAITHDQCIDFYRKKVSPQGAILSIVGNLQKHDINSIIESCVGSWNAPAVADLAYPVLEPVRNEIINVQKNRDQIVLAFAGLSVDRMNPVYDALLVFDQILVGGMSSRLFSLREQSGLFYTIGGSIVYGAGKQPGLIYIKTIVSKDRLEEAQQAITQCLDSAIDSVTQQELDEAKEMVINTFPSLFETYDSMASTFVFLERYGLPYDYFEQRMSMIRSLQLEDVKKIVKTYLDTKKLVVVRIGRL